MALITKDLQENSVSFAHYSVSFAHYSVSFAHYSVSFARFFFIKLGFFAVALILGEKFLLFLRRLRNFDNILLSLVGGSDVE